MNERFFTRNEQSLKTEAQKAFDYSQFAKMPISRTETVPTKSVDQPSQRVQK